MIDTGGRVVLALSGGGAKGASHVGVYRALQENDLVPHHIVATSIGSVIGACFASGLTYEEVLHRVCALRRSDVAVPSPRMLLGPFARHLLQEAPWRETIAALVPARRFEDLPIPLTVTAVDAASGDLVLFGAGGRSAPLVDALYASCALPLYYPPAAIGDREYLDGGLRAVFPVDVAADFQPDVVIGAYAGPMLRRTHAPAPRPQPALVAANNTALRILMAAQAEEVMRRWRDRPPVPLVLIMPRIEGRGTFAVDRITEYVERGYRVAHRALTEATAA